MLECPFDLRPQNQPGRLRLAKLPSGATFEPASLFLAHSRDTDLSSQGKVTVPYLPGTHSGSIFTSFRSSAKSCTLGLGELSPQLKAS